MVLVKNPPTFRLRRATARLNQSGECQLTRLLNVFTICHIGILAVRLLINGISSLHSQFTLSHSWNSLLRLSECCFFRISIRSTAVFWSWQCRCKSCRFFHISLPPNAVGLIWSNSVLLVSGTDFILTAAFCPTSKFQV